ncbi:MAG: hypothetical protein E7287_03395 [Lachnospiraceae bacterium]|nr:hypothetical protein [Lachnospiraceae bacterium]
MHEIIGQILQGNFDYENGSLDFSCAKIELTLQKGCTYEGSFTITATEGQYANGYVTSTDLRMECLTPEFSGNHAEIGFCFHGEYMEEGDVVKGSFSIVSNQGEYYLPFVVSVEHTVLESSIGAVKNLFHFANLAKSNWTEAVNLFYSPEFARIFSGSDAQHFDSYRGLSVYPGNEQNVEEFLIQINKKQRVEFITEEAEISLDIRGMGDAYTVMEKKVDIIRNGWGYTRLSIACDGEFVFTEKEALSDDDFLGNHCRLPIYIDSSMCRRGKNFGRVILYNSHVSIEIPVVVSVGDGSAARQTGLAIKRSIVQLMEFYQAFRMKKITTATWLKETGKLVDKLIALDESSAAARLFKAQLLITEERFNEASWFLDHAEELLETSELAEQQAEELWAYYWYLTTLIKSEAEYSGQVSSQVELIYKRQKGSWRVAWLLLYLSPEYNRSASVKWQFLERQFAEGCNSFIIYIEALHLINANPTLLRKLDEFELQIIYYGAKHEMLSTEVVEQFLYLVGKARGYKHILYLILEKLYHKKSDVRILQEICTLLIKGGKAGISYYKWYEAGVEAKLRITNLYEYYMMSLDLDSPCRLPKMVLMYFSYQNNLDYVHSAYLYNYIVQNRSGMEELYESYQTRIEYFVLDQIKKEHINRHLANLYNKLLTPEMIGEDTATPLSKLLFANRVKVEDDRLRKVFVYQPGNEVPGEYVLSDGETWVALYGNEYTIVFEDCDGNRYIKNVEYSLEKLMLPGKHLRLISGYVHNSPEFDLYLFEGERDEEEFTHEGMQRALRLTACDAVDKSIRHSIQIRLLKQYYGSDEMRALEELMEGMITEDLHAGERSLLLKYLVLCGKYEEAEGMLRKYGPYFADLGSLVRLVGEMIFRNGMVEDEVLTATALCVFKRGKYDGNILQYLAAYYRGMTKDLRDVWKAARDFEVERYNLCERMLIQMLYTGAFVGEKMELFRYYVMQGAKPEVESAFLSQCAYDYFIREKVTDAFVFKELQNMYQRGENVHRVCKLACLKYYSEHKEEYTEAVSQCLTGWIEELMADRVHLNFFRNLKEFAHLTMEIADKTIIEYKTRPGNKAKIYYVILKENGESGNYLSEYMRDVCGGVCFKEFVLFFGETLQYYIMEEDGESEQLTESGNVQKSDITNTPGNSRYDMINDMVISKTLQDYDTLDSMLEEYYRKEYFSRHLFTLQ